MGLLLSLKKQPKKYERDCRQTDGEKEGILYLHFWKDCAIIHHMEI
jgi:hypothetical protein